MILAAAVLFTLQAASLAAADVRYETRVDDDNKVFVDVENGSRLPIRVTSVSVVFYDRRERVLRRRRLDCDDDCGVAPGATESFGPITGPRGWDTVSASEVLYEEEEEPEVEAAPRKRQPPAPTAEDRRSEAPRPPRSPGARPPAAVDWSSPEAVLRAFYVALNRGDLERARGFFSGTSRAFEDLEGWARRETRGGTVTEIRLREPVSDARPRARVEVSFADGGKAVRNVLLRREGESWKIETLEPSP